jgi:hypothetical protein
MLTTLLLTAVLLFPGDEDPPRKPHPLAPSLPALTREEEDKLDRTIDRFIQYDTGKLLGKEGLEALREFEKLGPEAIPALIRGLNRAADIDHSCPVLVITKKLVRLLGASNDAELMDFARENIGIGVSSGKHAGLLRELRTQCMIRRNALAKAGTGNKSSTVTAKTPKSMSVGELAEALGREKTLPKLKPYLVELEQRKGDEALTALGGLASSEYDRDVQQFTRDLLVKNLIRQPPETIKEKLKASLVEVRRAALLVATTKKMPLGDQFIDLLADEDEGIRDAAHSALILLARGKDFGPKPTALPADREDAIRQWRSWWAKQGR